MSFRVERGVNRETGTYRSPTAINSALLCYPQAAIEGLNPSALLHQEMSEPHHRQRVVLAINQKVTLDG